jgi:hypothetical protein
MSGQLNKLRAKTVKTTVITAEHTSFANEVRTKIESMLCPGCWAKGEWVSNLGPNDRHKDKDWHYFVTIHGVVGLPASWEPSNDTGIHISEIHNVETATQAIVDDIKRKNLTGVFKD